MAPRIKEPFPLSLFPFRPASVADMPREDALEVIYPPLRDHSLLQATFIGKSRRMCRERAGGRTLAVNMQGPMGIREHRQYCGKRGYAGTAGLSTCKSFSEG
jgi:hypothetical protein